MLIPVFLLFTVISKDWQKILLTLIIGLSILLIYFPLLNYLKPNHHPDIASALSDPLSLILYMLAFLGNIGKVKIVAIFFGSIFMMSFLFIAKKIYKEEPFLFWSIIYIAEIAFVTALSRVGFGVEQALSSRYAIYSLLLISLLYISYILIYKIQFLRYLGLFFSVIFFIVYFFYGTYWFKNHTLTFKYSLNYPDKNRAQSIMNNSISLNIFNPKDK